MKKRSRNGRKSQKQIVMTGRTFHVALFIASLLVMVVLNIVAETRCTQVRASIGEKEKALAQLDNALKRDYAAWERMTTEQNLVHALIRHGLNMNYPKSEQIINMDESGAPRHGQRSVELAISRMSGTVPVASNNIRRRRTSVRR